MRALNTSHRKTKLNHRRRRTSIRLETLETRQLLAGDLIAQWIADDLNGTADENGVVRQWTDSIGAISSNAIGSPTLVQNALGGRSLVHFDPSDDDDGFRVRVSDNPLADRGDFSVAVTFITDSQALVGGNNEWFTNSGLVDSNSLGLAQDWGLSINASGQVAVGMGSGFAKPTTTLYSTPSGLNDGQPHTIVVTRSGSNLSLYVDDQPADTTTDASDQPRARLDLTFGILQHGQLPFTGDIAQIRLFDGALTSQEVAGIGDEISAYYNNQAPVGVDDEYTLDEDAGLFFVTAADGLLKNDTDPDGDVLTAVIVDDPQHGEVRASADGSFLYTPDRNYNGNDSFTYTPVDFRPGNVTTVRLTINPKYDAPTAVDDWYEVTPGQEFVVPALIGVLANDLNPDQSPLTAVLEQGVANGTLSLADDGSFTFDPGAFSGTTNFTYRTTDGTTPSEPATVTLVVNNPPSAVDDQYDVDEDQELNVAANQGLLANDSDPEGDALTLTITSDPQNGQLEVQADGALHYVPTADFSGQDQFTYELSDGLDTSRTATVVLNVVAVNDPPISSSDTYVVDSSDQFSVSAEDGLLKNDVDVDGPSLTAVLVDEPTQGSITLRPDGSFDYRPAAGFAGVDTFTYQASDSLDQSSVTSVTLVSANAQSRNTNPTGDSIVTFNEIMYNPEGSDSEWLELHNQMAIDMDISGWRLSDGVTFHFPEGTIIPGNGYLVIAEDPDELIEAGVTNVMGPFEGRLDNGGEQLELRNNSNRIMDVMTYNDRGRWPVGADGSGASLAKRRLHVASDVAANWVTSPEIGGTPGAENMPELDLTPTDTHVIPWDSSWRYEASGTDLGTAWKEPAFDDQAWQSAPGLFRAGIPPLPDSPGALAEPGQGLVGYWPLEASSGTVAENVVEGGADATLVNMNVRDWVDDPTRGTVLDFDGNNDHLLAGEVPAIGQNDDFTWSLWFEQDDADVPNGVILGNRSGGSQSPLQFVKFTPTNFEYYSDAGDPIIPFALTDDVWTHLAVVKSGSTLTYYINGEMVGSGETTSDMGVNPLFIGGDPDADEFADGRIDDIAMWNRDLPAASIQGLASGQYTPLTAPTVFVDARTDLPLAPTTYFRQDFELSEDPGRTELLLTHLLDDGAVVYLNGQEVWRQNLPNGPISYSTAASQEVGEVNATGPISLPTDALQLGQNVLAVEVHQHVGAISDMFFGAQLTTSVTPFDPSTVPYPVLNELTGTDAQTFQVEIYNPNDEAVDLLGYRIESSDGDRYQFDSQMLAAGSYLVLDQTQLGFRPAAGERVFLLTPGGTRYVDGQVVAETARARSQQHDGRWLSPAQVTMGSANQFAIDDNIVINEIQYHAPGFYVETLDRVFENNEQWIELYNRSTTATVDLSGWEFTAGVEYVFPEGTMLGPDQYLVISGDPTALISSRPGLNADQVVGPFNRNLSNAGELIELSDNNGNPVDWVHYYEKGRWPATADARGATLELRNPHADNAVGEAWGASDETDQVQWQTITYSGSGRSNRSTPTQYHEFLLGLLNDGEVLIDDVQVVENPGTPEARQIIQNGSFEDDAVGDEPAFWRIIGTQHGSVIQDPDNPNNQVLRLVATGPTEHMHNNAGTTLKDGDDYVRLRNDDYEISFRAKWVAGSDQLNARLYFNRLQTTTRLGRPVLVGTPGQVNSQFESNIGPTYDQMIHSPAVPDADQPVTVSIVASDPQGIQQMQLFYSVEGGAFTSVPMQPGSEGTYEGVIPGQASAQLVHFYVQGTDAMGAETMFPTAGPESRALYRVQDGEAMNDQRHNLRILMTDEDADFLHERTNVMSNNRIGATVIYRESEIFYDVGVRLKGSERGRNQQVRVGFNIGFDPAQPFRGVHTTIGVDRSGSGNQYSQEEIIVRQIINHAGNMPQIYDDLIHVIAPNSRHTGSAMLNMARYNDVFLDSQYENGSLGTAFEYELIYYPTTTLGGVEGLKIPEPDSVVGVNLSNLGDDKELYRWNFLIKNNRRQDDYSQIMEALNAIGGRTNDPNYFPELERLLDVDVWLRSFAALTLAGIGDNYASGAQHNGMFYVRPADNRLLFLPWDMDFSFTQGSTSGVVNNGDLRKFLNDPGHEHNYYGHLHDIIQTTFNADYMNRWIDHFDQLVPAQGSTEFQSFKNYINTRANRVNQLIEQAIDVVPFEITTQGPIDVGDSPTAQINGTGWVDVREIRLAGQNIKQPITWTTPNQWQLTLPVGNGTNEVTIEAYDFQGQLVGSDSITISSTAVTPVRDFLRVSEIHYNPLDSQDGEPDVNNDDFEFIELINVGTEAFDLENVQFVLVDRDGDLEGFTFTFASQSLQPQERIVVPQDVSAFRARYGENVRLALGHGGDPDDDNQYSGRMGNGGETITMVDATGAIIQQFTYDDAWYDVTDGNGPSLEFIDPTLADLDAWNQGDNWRPSGLVGGTPGEGRVVAGDANRDGIFDSADLIAVMQAGEYEDDIPGNSTWEEGDWDYDGDFTTSDLVVAFREGNYVLGAVAAGLRGLDADVAAALQANDSVRSASALNRPLRRFEQSTDEERPRRQVTLNAAIVDRLFDS